MFKVEEYGLVDFELTFKLFLRVGVENEINTYLADVIVEVDASVWQTLFFYTYLSYLIHASVLIEYNLWIENNAYFLQKI